MNKKLKNLVDELSLEGKDTSKISQVFSAIEDIWEKTQADPGFKTHLQKRLENIMEMNSMVHQVKSRRWYLFGWAFASFLFLWIFLYYLSTTFFSMPFDSEIKTIQTPRFSEDSSISNTTIAPEPPVEKVPTESSRSPKNQSLEEPEVTEIPVNTLWDENQQTLPMQDVSDNNIIDWQDTVSSQDSWEDREVSSLSETWSEENIQKISNTSQDVDTMSESWISGWSSPASSMMKIQDNTDVSIPSSQTVPVDFKESCRSIGWVYVRIEPIEQCHKDNQICEKKYFDRNGSCDFVVPDTTQTASGETIEQVLDQ